MKKNSGNKKETENPDKRLQKIIDDKKNESSALRKILKSLDKNVKQKNKNHD